MSSGPDGDPHAADDDIAALRRRLADLDRERADLVRRIDALLAGKRVAEQPPPVPLPVMAPVTASSPASEKIALLGSGDHATRTP
jgi:hypothetical protein